MEEFDVNGAVIRFSEEKVRYNSIRKEFLNQANEYRDKLKKELSKNYTSKDINETSLKLYEEYIESCIKKGVELVVNYEIITIDTNLFRRNYCLKYLTYYKKSKNLSKEHSTQNKNKKISLAQKSMEDKKLINTLSDYLFEDCFKIHYAVIDALLDNGVKIVASYIEEENIIKSNALFNNYKDGFIDKTNESYVIKQIIALNPYRQDVYEFFIKEDGDFNKEIERLTKFLGYDVKGYKESLMERYVENIKENQSYEVEIEKEKVEKYAKYIGYDKKEIYCARVEALYIYKNA